MSAELKELGTLIVVVGKARNLPNKSRFGKQDPFCTVTVGEHKQKTKSIKRGGQTPEWDEELRFTIVENVDDLLVRSESQPGDSLSSLAKDPTLPPKDAPGVVTPAALASRSRKGPIGKKGGKSLKIACFADDAKEPELIGECVVDIEHVLKQGEEDEWYEITSKEKYSGEIYMELTFYSNDAPPVKRNVPRPSVHGYPSSSTADSISSRSSLSAASSASTLAAPHSRLSTSGGVSGMSLYIPPYVQQSARVPSPSPSGSLSASTSFQDLGLPPGHSRTPSMQSIAPGQPSYPPSSHQSAFQSAFDALSTPMNNLSINTTPGPSYPDRSTTPVPQGHHAYRHSVGGVSEAPWAAQLPQAQARITPTPQPRPMSTNDALPWQHLQQADVDRPTSGASGIARPVSGQGYAGVTPRPDMRPSSAAPAPLTDYSPASPIPPSLQSGQMPHHRHTSSFSHLAAALQAQSPLPPPPLTHAQTAPPASSAGHYPVPLSSFPTQQYQQQPSAQLPNITGGYQPYSARVADTYPPTPPNPGPASAPPDAPSSNGYVPWYQQTQPVAGLQDMRRASTPGEAHYQHPQQPQQQVYQATSPGQYTSGPPPPIPSHRPVANPSPAPPQRPVSVGYYPSDELYAIQERERQAREAQAYRAPSPVPPPQSMPSVPSSSSVVPWEMRSNHHQHAAPSHQPSYTHDSQAYDSPQSQSGYSSQNQSSFSPSHSFQGAPQGWQSTFPQPPPQRSTSPLPPSQSHPTGSYHPYNPASSTSPYDSQAQLPRPPSPLPPTQSAPSGWQTNGEYEYSNTQPPAPPPRSPSPLPPSQTFHSYSQHSQTYQSTPTSAYSHAVSPVQTPPAPQMQQPQQPRQDWRSYIQSLGNGSPGSGSAMGARGSSPQPLSFQQKIHTPPPPIPESIRPPDGWRSTLPPSNSEHHWRN